MELKVQVLGYRRYVSPQSKTGKPGFYASVSYNGQAKTLYMPFEPVALGFVVDPNNAANYMPRDGKPVAATFQYGLGGYKDSLGLDISAVALDE